jgi:serine/threonine protein kinase/Tol biopolymer transport system component
LGFATGTRLGPYQLTALLGEGGMGAVYHAHDIKLNRDVALKVLLPEVANDPERLARFRREAQVLASLNHPHIGGIYGLEEGPAEAGHHTIALVLELVEGSTLADRIARGPIPIDEALPIARQIAEALEAAHEQGIVHRDLKPANIKVRDDGTVKVLDFGLAKAIEPQTGAAGRGAALGGASMSPTMTSPAMMTGVGIILGTAAYMAPEQARGRAVDKRADIWAFGCVLYEILAGRRAFDGDDVTDVLSRVLQREPEWQALPSTIPPHLATLLSRCLEKDPRKRLRDIGDARLMLDESLVPVLGAASVPSSVEQPRRRASWILAGGAFAAGIALASGAAWTLRPQPATQQVVRFETDLRMTLTDLYRGGPVVSPDGRHIVVPTGRGLRIRDIDALESRMLYSAAEPPPGTLSALTELPIWPAYSPDGQSIAFFEGTQLKRMASNGGAATVVTSAASVPLSISWTTADTIVFAQREGVMRVAASGGTPELIVPRRAGEAIATPQLLPDGRTVLYTAARGSWKNGQIVLQRIGSEDRIVLASGAFAAHYVPTGHLLYVSGSQLLALPIDSASLKPLGKARPVLDGISGLTIGAAPYGLADSGTLAYVKPAVSAPTTMVWVDRTGHEEAIAAPTDDYDMIRVSPRGDRISFNSGFFGTGKSSIYSLSRNVIEQLGADLLVSGSVRWSPDGEYVVFYGEDVADGPGLFRSRADGSGKTERLATGNYVPASWSADGRYIVYVDFGAGRPGTPGQVPDLAVLTFEDGRVTTRTVMKTAEWEDDAALSPDGRWLVYEANQGGGNTTDIYVRPFPDVERGRWRVSDAGGGFDAVWSRDGRTLFYRSGRAVRAVRVAGATPGEWSRPETLFEGDYVRFEGLGPPEFDVGPDGRFLMLKSTRTAAPPPPAVVVLNFLQELERLVPAK